MYRILSKFVFITLLLAGCSFAAKNESVGNSDKMFVAMSVQDVSMEIALSNVALEKTRNPLVSDFAAAIVRERTRSRQELLAIAERQGFEVEGKLDPVRKSVKNHLKQFNGEALDEEYAALVVAEHEKLLARLQDRARRAKSEELRQFAVREARVVQTHLEMARGLQLALAEGQ